MKKEELIKKWLDDELSSTELLEFQQLEEYNSYMKLSEKAVLFKAPVYNTSEAYKKLQPIIEQKRIRKSLLQQLKPILKIAAIFIIGFVVYTSFFTNNITTVTTIASQKTTLILPDNSVAKLNSLSEIKYRKTSWEENREITLEGEAYFKVAKGSKFNVNTSAGIVSVLGTQFNVKNRKNYFEVKCFEGKVSVLYNEKTTLLTAGKSIRIVNGHIKDVDTDLKHPTWINNYSTFKSVPFSEVIAEFERQYSVRFLTNTNTKLLFTGTFTHEDKKLALESITIPLGLKYIITDDVIRLESK